MNAALKFTLPIPIWWWSTNPPESPRFATPKSGIGPPSAAGVNLRWTNWFPSPSLAIWGGNYPHKSLAVRRREENLIEAIWINAAKTPQLPQIRAVHRLDRDTSGLMVFARTPQAEAALIRLFSKHRIERAYLAVVHGAPSRANDRIAAHSRPGRRPPRQLARRRRR
jgi:hypothetical protein